MAIIKPELLAQLAELLEQPSSPRLRFSPLGRKLRSLLSFEPWEAVLKAALMHQVRNQIRGDYAEFGVFRGCTLMLMYFLVQETDEYLRGVGRVRDLSEMHAILASMRFFGFDSFAGMPAAAGDDAGIMAEGDLSASRADVEERMRSNGVAMDRVRLVEGFYEETLSPARSAALDLSTIAIAHVDCDYYDSTRVVLQFLTERLADESILVFDDWYLFKAEPDRGEQKAFAEWTAANPGFRTAEFMSSGWSKAFLVYRR
jgi:hypothetical protein